MTKKILIALVGLSLALLVGAADAQTEVGIRFGIRPTKAYEDRPETFSYFSYELEPGAVFAEEALVQNSGDEPVTLTLYAADGFTAINTGTAFTKRNQEATGFTRGVNRWLFLPVTEIALEPGEEVIVPFTINVPEDAAPGEHVAGLVVEAPPKDQPAADSSEQGQFGAIVIQQSGVAVVIKVPGTEVSALEYVRTCLKEQGDLGATFEVDVRSRGNIIVKGEGSLSIMDRDLQELASVPLTMGSVLPGDATTFQVTDPVHLADGDYILSGLINYEGKTAIRTSDEIKVKDGQPDVGCHPELDEEAAAPPFSITDLVPLSPPGGGGIVWYAGGGALALALALLLFILVRRRRRSKRQKEGAAAGAPDEASPDQATPPAKAEAAGESPPSEAAAASPAQVAGPGDNGHSPEEIVALLSEADTKLGAGLTVLEVCMELGVTQQTYYRWRRAYGG